MANNNDPQRRKRGRPTDKLCVRLFLLDSDSRVTKVTKETCSKKGLNQLKEKGCGPPKREYCTSDDNEKVEFSFDLSHDQFKQKLVEIYPKLENAFFVLMKADKNNVLVELNHGICCYRCYTPENVYNSERGQGRLYIQIIAENEISPCTHGAKRWRNTDGNFIPILPKPGSESISVATETGNNPVAPVTMPAILPTNQHLIAPAGNESTTTALDLSSLPIVLAQQPAQHSGNMEQGSMIFPTRATQSFLNVATTHERVTSSNVITQMATPVSQSSGNMTTGTLNNMTSLFSPQLSLRQSVVSMPAIISQTSTTPAINSSGVLQNLLPAPSTVVSLTLPRQSINSLVNMLSTPTAVSHSLPRQPSIAPQGLQLPSTIGLPISIPGNTLSAPSQSFNNAFRQGQLHTTQQQDILRLLGITDTNVGPTSFHTSSPITSFNPAGESEQELRGIFNDMGRFPIGGGNLNRNTIPPGSTVPYEVATITLHDPNSVGTAPFSQLSSLPTSNRAGPSPGLDVLALVSQAQREQHVDNAASCMSEQGSDLNLPEPEELSIDEFLENVEATKKLEISSEVLRNDALLKKLQESTITIDIVSIQSSCKVLQVLRNYSLPSSLKVLKIHGSSLNLEEISDLVTSLGSVNGLQELHLYGTKFLESSSFAFICVLNKCKDLASLTLSENSLTEQELNGLTTALNFESMKNLKNLNLSKNNFNATQVNDILKKLAQAESIVSLDLSQNALQGTEIVSGICKLQSVEELNLSHNSIKFSPLHDLDEACDSLSTNMKTILLSSNHMTPDDISQFCSLIRSDLQQLNLDTNHVRSSIWSLCSLGSRIKQLKVLSLANTDICLAVDGLASLLTLVRRLEDLNLSGNNLMLADFEKIVSPLSKLTNMKKLDLSKNYVGADWIKVLSDMLKEFPLLESLNLSESYIKEDDISVLCNSLLKLKKLRCLNLLGNRIDVEVLDDAFPFPSTLEELSLSDVIHGEKLFKNWKSSLPNLLRLQLSNLKLRPCDVEVLADMLLSCPKLEELCLPSADIAVPYGSCEIFCDSIKLLSNIKKIDLTGIKVPHERTLADTIKSLLSLEELVLTDMKIANSDNQSLWSAMRFLKGLRKLHLGGVRVRDVKAFFDMLSFLSNLEEFVFPDLAVRKTDDITEHFSVLESLSCLKNLNLRRNEIREPLRKALSKVLPSMHLLEKLALGEIDKYNECQEELLVAVGKLKYLKEFYVNIFKKSCLAQALSTMPLLEKVELHGDPNIDKQAISALGNMRYLKKLYLSYSKPVSECLPLVLPSLQMLEKLVLWVENWNGVVDVFAALGTLRYLKKLTVRKKWDVRCGTLSPLWESLCSLPLLEKLVLVNVCENDPESFKQLFTAIGRLKYLKKLRLHFECITVTHTQAFAKIVESLQMLEELGLFVRCTGECDEEFVAQVRKLKYLKKLDTSVNMQYLHRCLPSLQMLEKLKISENRNARETTVSFAALGKLKFLKVLELLYFVGDVIDIEALLSLHVLEKLKLVFSENQSLHVYIQRMFRVLKNFKYLKKFHFYLGDSEIVDVQVLAEMIPTLPLLETLNVTCKTSNFVKLFVALSELKYLKTLVCENTVTDVVLPSLYLLESLWLDNVDFTTNSNDVRVLDPLRSSRFLTGLYMYRCLISQPDATTILKTTLLQLQNLKEFMIPHIVGDEQEKLRREITEEICRVHGIWNMDDDLDDDSDDDMSS